MVTFGGGGEERVVSLLYQREATASLISTGKKNQQYSITF